MDAIDIAGLIKGLVQKVMVLKMDVERVGAPVLERQTDESFAADIGYVFPRRMSGSFMSCSRKALRSASR
jgi:hypothetical protein